MQSNGHKSLVKMLLTSSKIINDTLGLVSRVVIRRQQLNKESPAGFGVSKATDEAQMEEVKQQLEIAKERVDALMQRMSFEKAPSHEQVSLGMGLGGGSSVNAANREQDDGNDGSRQ